MTFPSSEEWGARYSALPTRTPDSTNHKARVDVRSDLLLELELAAHDAVAERLSNFERYFESIARPFEWKFTRADLTALIARMRNRWAQSQHLRLAA